MITNHFSEIDDQAVTNRENILAPQCSPVRRSSQESELDVAVNSVVDIHEKQEKLEENDLEIQDDDGLGIDGLPDDDVPEVGGALHMGIVI